MVYNIRYSSGLFLALCFFSHYTFSIPKPGTSQEASNDTIITALRNTRADITKVGDKITTLENAIEEIKTEQKLKNETLHNQQTTVNARIEKLEQNTNEIAVNTPEQAGIVRKLGLRYVDAAWVIGLCVVYYFCKPTK